MAPAQLSLPRPAAMAPFSAPSRVLARYYSSSIHPRPTRRILSRLLSARALHILQSPSASLPPASLDASALVKHVPQIGAGPEPDEQVTSGTEIQTSVSQAEFNVIGTPGSILQVALPASSPLYARRGSLLAALSPTSSSSPLSLQSALEWSRGVLTRAATGQRPLAFQKLTATQPVSLLLRAPGASAPAAVLALDGRVDWALTAAAAVLAYAPLSAALYLAPHRASSSSPATTTVTGRGLVALTPTQSTGGKPAQVFKVVLAEGESLLVVRAALLAYSLEGAAGVRAFRHPAPEALAATLRAPTDPAPATTTSDSPATGILATVKSVWSRATARLRRPASDSASPYYRVHGPTTLLLNSAPPTGLAAGTGPLAAIAAVAGLLTRTATLLISRATAAAPLETRAAQVLVEELRARDEARAAEAAAAASVAQQSYARDHLRVVTIGADGKARFESVDSFQQFVTKK